MNKFMKYLYTKYATKSLSAFHTAWGILSVLLYAGGKLLNRSLAVSWGEAAFLICVISWLIHYNQSNLFKYLSQNKTVSYLPAGEIKLKNNLLLVLFLIISLGLMFLISEIPIKNILGGLWGLIVSFLRKILKFFKREASEPESETALDEAEPEPLEEDLYGVNYEAPLWAQAVDALLRVLAYVIIIAVIIGVFYVIYKKLMEPRRRDVMEEHEFIMPGMKRSKAVKEEKAGEKRLVFDRSPNGRMRRLYVKIIKKEAGKTEERSGKKGKRRKINIPKALTPKEIEKLVKMPESELNIRLHEYYEKARYSKDGCTGEDIKELKGQKM